jgi:DNA-binding MarR family transcriptional regulator
MTVDTAGGSRGTISPGGDDSALQLMLAMHRLVRDIRRQAGTTGLHPTQLLVLVQLVDAGPQRVGELAAKVPCSQPTVTAVANGLEEAGLVRRVRDTTDGRAIRLCVTDAGRAALLEVVRNQAALLRQRLDVLDEPDRDLVLAAAPILRRMANG